MRLYRGLKELYRPEAVGAESGPTSPNEMMRTGTAVTWPDARAKRFMVWEKSDHFIVAAIPAKDLNAREEEGRGYLKNGR